MGKKGKVGRCIFGFESCLLTLLLIPILLAIHSFPIALPPSPILPDVDAHSRLPWPFFGIHSRRQLTMLGVWYRGLKISRDDSQSNAFAAVVRVARDPLAHFRPSHVDSVLFQHFSLTILALAMPSVFQSLASSFISLEQSVHAQRRTHARTHAHTHTHTHTHTITQPLNHAITHSLTHAWVCAPSANISDSDVMSPTQKQCRQISLFTSPTTTPLPERSRLYRGGFDHTKTSLPP